MFVCSAVLALVLRFWAFCEIWWWFFMNRYFEESKVRFTLRLAPWKDSWSLSLTWIRWGIWSLVAMICHYSFLAFWVRFRFMKCHSSENKQWSDFEKMEIETLLRRFWLPRRLDQDNWMKMRLPDVGNISSARVFSDQEIQGQAALDLASDSYLHLVLRFVRADVPLDLRS